MGSLNHTKATRRRVLAELRDCGRVDIACRRVGVDRSSHYAWLKKHADYRQEYEDSLPEISGRIEDVITGRGLDGWDEPVFHGGKRAMDFARDAEGNLILQECKVCAGTGRVGQSAEPCGVCFGTGKGKNYVSVPAVVRKFSDACALALAAARVPGFNQRVAHRIVDKNDDDRNIGIDAVRAYMEADTDED